MRAAKLLLLAGLLTTTGCGEVTWWDARGQWSGAVTLPGTARTVRSGSVSDPDTGPSEDRIRLCDQTRVDLGLPFVPIERDRPAAIELITARPLCQEGRTQITGGAVLLWANPPGQPNVLGAVRSDAWTVTGEIEITTYLEQSLPDLEAGETVNTERVEGTFTLTATGGTGQVIRIEGATFELDVVASRVRFSPS